MISSKDCTLKNISPEDPGWPDWWGSWRTKRETEEAPSLARTLPSLSTLLRFPPKCCRICLHFLSYCILTIQHLVSKLLWLELVFILYNLFVLGTWKVESKDLQNSRDKSTWRISATLCSTCGLWILKKIPKKSQLQCIVWFAEGVRKLPGATPSNRCFRIRGHCTLFGLCQSLPLGITS